MSAELVQVVDDNDVPVGAATKQEIWQRGLLHRIVRVMVEDEQGNVLLQKRSLTKPNYPGYWDNSAAGHVDEGESYDEAANRELREELGIEAVLKEVKYYRTHGMFEGLKLNRFNKLYTAVILRETTITMAEDEVAAYQWFSRAELTRLLQDHSAKCSDGLQEAYVALYAP